MPSGSGAQFFVVVGVLSWFVLTNETCRNIRVHDKSREEWELPNYSSTYFTISVINIAMDGNVRTVLRIVLISVESGTCYHNLYAYC